MNLLDYLNLSEISDKARAEYKKGFIGNAVTCYSGKEHISEYQVGFVGIDDARNSFPKKSEFSTDIIRNYLYKLSGLSKLSIIDFGNLKQGNTIKDTYASIKKVAEYFSNHSIIVVFIGGTQEMSTFIAESYFKKNTKLEFSFIDAIADYIDDSDFHSRSYLLNGILGDQSAIVKNLIGFQSYLISNDVFDLLKNKGYNLFRLGGIRNNFQSIEPILRDSDFISFDLSSVRQGDSPSSEYNSPNGFYAEESCQLGNICGLSDIVKGLHICGLNTANDINGQSAHLMAQIIWHFILGLSNRKGEYPKRPLSAYKKIYVNCEKAGHDFVFYKNEENNRFWVELPSENKEETEVIACAESDYIAVCSNEIPERIWKRISNLMK